MLVLNNNSVEEVMQNVSGFFSFELSFLPILFALLLFNAECFKTFF